MNDLLYIILLIVSLLVLGAGLMRMRGPKAHKSAIWMVAVGGVFALVEIYLIVFT